MFTGSCTWFSCRERRPRPSPRAAYSSSSSHSSSVLKVPSESGLPVIKFLACFIMNILLTELRWPVWENLDLSCV